MCSNVKYLAALLENICTGNTKEREVVNLAYAH